MSAKTILVSTSILFFSTTFLFGYLYFSKSYPEKQNALVELTGSDHLSCNYKISRLGGHKLISPLVYAEPDCESRALVNTKVRVEQKINELKARGVIGAASIYFREFNKGLWFNAGDAQRYSPGSLLKVPELITFYKMREKNPQLFTRKIINNRVLPTVKTIHFNSIHLEFGKEYTVEELLFYMIVYSDNQATSLLNDIIDVQVFKKVFTDLGLAEPDWKSPDYPIAPLEYSVFLKALYNAAYLNIQDSEDCMALLAKTVFKQGMRSAFPETYTIAHKFGEGGFTETPSFCESGIVYAPAGTFLLTIMTKGNDLYKLPEAVSEISRIFYDQIQLGQIPVQS